MKQIEKKKEKNSKKILPQKFVCFRLFVVSHKSNQIIIVISF